MKGLFKFTTAALALLTMASCSNDDLFGNGESAQTPEEGALVVEMEDLIDHVSTRAALVPESNTKNTIYWQNWDAVKVQDEALVKYDYYRFDSKKGSFVNANDENKTFVGEPKYALFPGYSMSGEWIYGDDQNVVNYTIPREISFSEDKNIVGDGTIAYYSNLPMWGEAASEGDGVKVNLHYLTAVLRVYLKNAKSNIKNFKVEAYEDQACTKPLAISGDAEAVISENGEPKMDAQLEFLGTSLPTNNRIYVSNIENATADAYLYIPLFAQKYGALKFYYTTDAIDYSIAWNAAGGREAVNWKLIKTTKPMTLKRQTVYRLSLESFEVAGDNLESINAILAGQTESTADVNVNTQKPTTLSAKDNVLKIPAGMKANITLNLEGLNLGANNLEIESEDGNYAGTVVINTTNAATGTGNVYINLPKANVVFVGDYSAIGNFGLQETKGIDNDKLVVKSLTFSNGESETPVTIANNVFVDKESTEAITVDKLATVTKIELQPGNANVGEIVVNGTVTGNINADKANNIAAITVNGTVGGNIWANGDVTIEGNAKKVVSREGDITIGDEATYAGELLAANGEVAISTEKTIPDKKITAKTLALSGKANLTTIATAANVPAVDALTIEGSAKVADITINDKGTAEINVDAQDGACEAVTGTLTVGKSAKITLTQGYINKINNNAATADEPVELTFGEEEGYTAINTVSSWNIKPTNASTWNGKAIPAAVAATYTAADIWTACQLATPYTAATRLMNDIDLDEAAWTMPALTNNIVGVDKMEYALGLEKVTYPTISGLKATAKDANGTGLFATATGTLKNFTIDGATITSDKSNVGVIAGITTGAVTIQNVTIKNASVVATGESDNIGGLIGKVAHNATIGATDNPVNVTLTKLQGRYNLGGLIGEVAAGTTGINVTKTEITAIEVNGALKTVPSVGTPSDDKAGAVGMYIGLISAAGTPTVNIDAANKGTNYIDGHRKDLGFQANFVTNTHVYYGMKTAEVGQCKYNLYVGGVAQIGGTNYDTVAGIAANKINVYVKVGAADYK